MTDIDIDKLLEPVSEDAPCGEDLEYEPEFGELERAVQGKAAQEMGDKKNDAVPPNWNEVADLAEPLFARSKDLRVATYLTHAKLNLDGLPGLASGLDLINKMLQQYWDNVHPELDADDDNDPTLRMNSLMPLNSAEEFVASLERTILVSSKVLGRFSMRDMRLAKGEITLAEGDDTAIPDPAHIDGAFLECEMEELTANSDACSQCVDTLKDLEEFARDKVGIEFSPDLSALTSELGEIHGIYREQLARRGVDLEPVEGGEETGAAAPKPVSGEVNSREDAVRVLDKVCEYFRKNEPSSPVPLLLQRAKRLVSKDFMEILRDLTPQGVSEAEMIGGVDPED